MPTFAQPRLLSGVLLLLLIAGCSFAQSGDDPIRVTVTMNPDDSKTIYQTDPVKRVTIATSIAADGKARGRIIYKIDSAGRNESGEVFGPDGRLRMKTEYEYDSSGRLAKETQRTKDGKMRSQLVYSYDAAGHQAGYAVYDGEGRLLGRTRPRNSATLSPAARQRAR